MGALFLMLRRALGLQSLVYVTGDARSATGNAIARGSVPEPFE